jgi:phosphopantothenoylcysteine synthetase/decarboxylase
VKKSARKHVLITAGPTRESMDPVRFLTNPSSGKMGLAIASALQKRGFDVCVVCGPTHERLPAGVDGVAVETAAEMASEVRKRLSWADVFIATAAVTDWRFAKIASHKIKKRTGGAVARGIGSQPRHFGGSRPLEKAREPIAYLDWFFAGDTGASKRGASEAGREKFGFDRGQFPGLVSRRHDRAALGGEVGRHQPLSVHEQG